MSKGPGPGIGSNTGMDTAHTIDHRLTELEIKSSYAEDLLDTLNQTIFRLTFEDGPNWLNDPQLALFLSMLMHIWKSLPFWTLILLSGRLAIAKDLYEAAAVDGASNLQKFRWITWPSMAQLYLTCALLSTIWTLGDFNSVYLLTGGGPADLTHVLATLGIRYLRLAEVDMSMATIVTALPLILPLVYFMMKRLSR